MSRKKIKLPKARKGKVRGRRQTERLGQLERNLARQNIQDNARRRRLTKRDLITGEIYVLSLLALKDKKWVTEYKKGLDEALAAAPITAEDQAEAIRGYLQGCVDAGHMVTLECGRGDIPSCRVYQGENARVVVIRQDDPDLQ